MATIEEIESAVRRLSEEDQRRLMDRLGDLLWDAWDRQVKRDVVTGKLDTLIQEANQDIAHGRTTPLDEIIDHP